MDYKARLPEQNDNVSHEHPFKEFAYLLAALFGISVLVYVILGLLVEFTVSKVSPELEYQWLSGSALNQSSLAMITEGAALEPYSPPKFEELKRCADISIPIALWKVASEVPNAVAIPGGDIVILDGLLDKIETENGLSFILAHELAHFKQRDHLRALGRGIVIIAVASAVTGGGSMSRLISPAVGLEQAQYSQSRESSADALALDILHCAYGHVGGATEFFEALKGDEHLDLSGVQHWFSTHPQMQKRIDDLNRLAKAKGYKTE